MNLSLLYYLYARKRVTRKRFMILRRLLQLRTRRVRLKDSWTEKAFHLNNFSELECWVYFRFQKDDLQNLRKALSIPDEIWTAEGDHVSGLEALCVILRRLAYPNRWIELRKLFGRSSGSLSRIFYTTVTILDRRWSEQLTGWDHSWCSEERFELYASTIVRKGGVFPDVFGFIDGTARPICRPKENQQIMYSGHKRVHCTKWQAVVLPNGLIIYLYGGEPGSMHDSRMFSESGFLASLRGKQANFQRKFVVYGDSGYGRNEYLLKPFSSLETRTNALKRLQNAAMFSVREGVEWGFKEMATKFAFVDFKKQMKIFEKPINKIYRVAVLLTNCINCMYPNQASQYFDLDPPSLEEYLRTGC